MKFYTTNKIRCLIFFVAIVSLGLGRISFAQETIQEEFKSIPNSIIKNDDDLESRYIDILEEINQQLSFRWSWFNVILCILALLVAFLAIYFGGMIYVQNKEYRDKLQEDRKNYKNSLDNFIKEREQEHKKWMEEHKKQLTEAKNRINKLVNKYEEKIKKSPDAEEINKILEELKKERDDILMAPSNCVIDPTAIPLGGAISLGEYHICSKCGRGFFNNADNPLAITLLPGKTAICPYCGNVDYI